jgi:DNA ligase-1
MKISKTMQPTDVDLTKLHYPVGASIKYDGVKACRFNNELRGRSFKNYRNEYLNLVYDNYEYSGFEGEIVVGTDLFANDLCRKTTSAVNTILNQPSYSWLVFDFVTDETIDLSYTDRLVKLKEHIASITFTPPEGCYIKVVDVIEINNEEELLAFEADVLMLGGEGIIIRDLNSKYKQGRVTVNSQECLRLKRFSDSEAVITGFNEQMQNTNEATVNALGRTTRTSHQENLIGKQTLGSISVRDFKTGVEFSIGSGFDDIMRQEIWENKDKYLGSIVKYKFFDKGVKNGVPRFPTFLSFRSEVDL